MLSKDDSAATGQGNVDDVLLAKNQEVLKIKLGKILEGHGPYAPYNMNDFEHRIKLPKAEDIMVAQGGESVDGYKITDSNLQYETTEGPKLAKETKREYEIGCELWYDYTTLLKTLEWSKDSTREVIDINIPRRSMKAIVLLCKRKTLQKAKSTLIPKWMESK